MKLWLIGVSIIFFCAPAMAQMKFQSLRYNEDYSYLNRDTTQNWYLRTKYKALQNGTSGYLSQGGEVRYQFQHFTNENWGDIPVKTYRSYYTRFLYHTDLHLTDHFRVFAQINSTFAMGRVTPNRSVDQNELDIQQVFMDLSANKEFVFRLGRQELLYGTQRLIAVREGPNNRQSYDAAKLIWKQKDFQLDVYYSHPVRVRPGILDDKFNENLKLWSVYTVFNQVYWNANIDAYYIGAVNKNITLNAGTAKEVRHSLGTRIWNKSAPWNYDIEALYQFGTFGSQSIHAYTASVNLNYTLDKLIFEPTIGFKTEVISGDKRALDTQVNTFNPLFPRGAYFGLAALIGPVNLIDFHPTISIQPTNSIEISVDYDAFWRYSLRDGIYGPNVMLLYGDASNERFIGDQVGFSVDYQGNDFLKITFEWMWFGPGAYLKAVSPGKQVFFGAFTAQFKF